MQMSHLSVTLHFWRRFSDYFYLDFLLKITSDNTFFLSENDYKEVLMLKHSATTCISVHWRLVKQTTVLYIICKKAEILLVSHQPDSCLTHYQKYWHSSHSCSQNPGIS